MTWSKLLSRDTLGLAFFLVLCFAVAGIGGLATASSVDTWYQTLNKPSWTPPGVVFGPVWTVLYAMMAVAAWRVWRIASFGGARAALLVFALQLALNLLWSWLFFGWNRIGLGLLDIGALWVAIVATIVLFRRHDAWATWLLVPYLLWVSFATALNGAIFVLNSA